MTGIYKITNKITGQIYIGQSTDIERRWIEHRTPKARGNNIVRCIETGEIYNSVGEFEDAKAYRGACSAYWAGRIKSVKGYHVEKV